MTDSAQNKGTKRPRSDSTNKQRKKRRTNVKKSNEEMISLYSASTETKNALEALLKEEHKKYIKQKKEAHDKISTILNSMSAKQEQRYECWNRSVIPKKIVKSIMNNVLNKHSLSSSKKKSNIDDKSVIVVQALAKCLVMELVAKSRGIQKETAARYIEEITYPPLDIDDQEDVDDSKKEDGTNANAKRESVSGIDLLMTKDVKKKESKLDINKQDNNNNDNDINEDFVLGAIRPVHIREALRKLQHDKGSFFCSNSKLFGTE